MPKGRTIKSGTETTPKKSRGAGDTVAKITKATGIDKAAQKVAKILGKEDCGCKENQAWLNEKISYVNTKGGCMNQEQVKEYEYLNEKYFQTNSNHILIKDQDDKKLIINLYNSIYGVHVKGCDSCNLKIYWDKITNVYNKLLQPA